MQSKEGQVDDRSDVQLLLRNIKSGLPALEALLHDCSSHWGYEDPVYRFYHQSFKVYSLQSTTKTIVASLQALAPDRALNESFQRIVADGTGHRFDLEHNQRWLEVTRPIIEAFLHARFFLEMAVRYGKQLAAAGPAERVGGALVPLSTEVDVQREWREKSETKEHVSAPRYLRLGH